MKSLQEIVIYVHNNNSSRSDSLNYKIFFQNTFKMIVFLLKIAKIIK